MSCLSIFVLRWECHTHTHTHIRTHTHTHKHTHTRTHTHTHTHAHTHTHTWEWSHTHTHAHTHTHVNDKIWGLNWMSKSVHYEKNGKGRNTNGNPRWTIPENHKCGGKSARGKLRRKHFSVYNTLQHTATHCNTLQHTATHCSTLQHTAIRCNTMHNNLGGNHSWESKEFLESHKLRDPPPFFTRQNK